MSKLARDFNISRPTVRRTIKRVQLQTFDSRPRSGRKRKLIDAFIRHIYRLTRRFPRLSWRALIAHPSEEVSISTVKRALKRNYNEKWKSKKRIPLTRKDAKKRVEFARLWLNTPFNTWIFSDECSVQRKSNSPTQFVFRFPNEAYRRDLVNLTNHGKDISQMVWGSIWVGGRSKLVIMERDEQSPRHGFTANSYINALENGLIENYEAGLVFQQDNARMHTAEIVQEWFENHGIWVVDWPPHSPDLNPIEHVWHHLRHHLMKDYPNIYLQGRSQMDWTQFHEAIIHSWQKVDQGVIDSLIGSMQRRLRAVIKVGILNINPGYRLHFVWSQNTENWWRYSSLKMWSI